MVRLHYVYNVPKQHLQQKISKIYVINLRLKIKNTPKSPTIYIMDSTYISDQNQMNEKIRWLQKQNKKSSMIHIANEKTIKRDYIDERRRKDFANNFLFFILFFNTKKNSLFDSLLRCQV